MKLRTKIAIVICAALLGIVVFRMYAATQAIGGGGSYFFPRPANVTGSGSNGAIILNSATGTIAQIFEAPKTGSVCAIGFRTGTETVSSTMMIYLETVSTSTGNVNGSGTLLAANTQVEANPLQAASTFKEWTLTASTTVTMGQLIGVQILPTSTAGAINMQIGSITIPFGYEFPYSENAIGTATWTKSTNPLVLSLQYCDGTYASQLGPLPYATNSTQSLSTSTSPNEIGIKYTPKVPQTVTGVWSDMSFASTTSAAIYYLYDSNTNILASTTVIYGATASNINSTQHHLHSFQSAVTLSANQTYRLTIQATSTTNQTMLMNIFSVTTSTMMNAAVGSTDVQWTQSTSSHMWVDTSTQLPQMGFIVNGFDDGVQAGGSGGGRNLFQILFGD